MGGMMRCGGGRLSKACHDAGGRQCFHCGTCGKSQTARSRSAFHGYRFPDEIIGLAVRSYLHYRLSHANIAELRAERDIFVDPSAIFAWVRQFTPLYQQALRPYRHRVRRCWAIDEISIKVAGVPSYVFRVIDDLGQAAADAIVGDDHAPRPSVPRRHDTCAGGEAHAPGDDLGRIGVATGGRGRWFHGRLPSHTSSSSPLGPFM